MSTPILSDYDLRPCNTLGLSVRARYFAELTDLAQLAGWRQDPHLAGLPWRVLGSGSNLLLTSEKLDALVIKVALTGRRLLRETDSAWWVAAAGGENWDAFVQWTLAQGWGGLENLALIPGTVGAAPVQNVGAYGIEIKDVLHELTAVHLRTGEVRQFTHADCHFAYRDSVFKQAEAGQWLISEVVFRLDKAHVPDIHYGDVQQELSSCGLQPTPSHVAQVISQLRQRKLPDPQQLGNAGSFFHNPIVADAQYQALKAAHPQLVAYAQPDGRWKLAAGWLIDQAGWKGRNLGPAGMYEKQALVLVNRGGATSQDVLALTAAVQADVFAQFGVELHPEPVRW